MNTASRFAATLVLALLASTSHAALVDVGNGVINHPDANLSWTADANLFLTMANADSALVTKIVAAWTDGPIPTLAGDGTTHTIVAADFNATSGRMNWYGARAWVNYLRTTHYKGYSDWRLPEVGLASLQTSGCTVCLPSADFPISTSEWWRLFFEELGGTATVPIATSNNGSAALFQNIAGDAFWANGRSGTSAALFRDGGEQTRDLTTAVSYRAWVVRTGQSVANPPAAPYITFAPENPVFPLTPYMVATTGNIVLRNVGTAAANISSVNASGADFSVTHTCGTSLAANATCVATVTFKPTDLFVRTSTLSVSGDTTYSTLLTGAGGMSATISASEFSAKEGKSVTLTWSSSPHAVCVGSGGTPGWAGPLMQAGSREVSSPDAGTFDYTITCTHDENQLPAAASVVRVYFTNVASGQFDGWMLLALTFALGLVVRSRMRVAARSSR